MGMTVKHVTVAFLFSVSKVSRVDVNDVDVRVVTGITLLAGTPVGRAWTAPRALRPDHCLAFPDPASDLAG
jgi:hypothetical protein